MVMAMAMAMKYARNKLVKKITKKKVEIRVLNTIGSHVSKAIEDGRISQGEFVLINEEQAKYSG